MDYDWVTFIYRNLAIFSKAGKFDKKKLEEMIWSWMPFKVRKSYTTPNMQEQMTFGGALELVGGK